MRKIIETRRRGTTTAEALESLASAIRDPGKWHLVRDHAASETSGISNQYQFERMRDIARALSLKFEFKRGWMQEGHCQREGFLFRSMHHGIEIEKDTGRFRFRELPDGEWVER